MTEVTIALSRSAAMFLRSVAQGLNDAKILPSGNARALETSAWLEEIEAAIRKALDDS